MTVLPNSSSHKQNEGITEFGGQCEEREGANGQDTKVIDVVAEWEEVTEDIEGLVAVPVRVLYLSMTSLSQTIPVTYDFHS